MASARQPGRNAVRWIVGAGVVVLAVGVVLLGADAQSRLEAAERSLQFTAEESELLGPEAEDIGDSLRYWSLFESLVMGSDARSFSVEIRESAAGTRDVSLTENEQLVLVSVRGSWHAAPVALPAFAGLVVAVGGLFLGAIRWRRHHETSKN